MTHFKLQDLCPELSVSEITRIACETGFRKRVEKKLHLTTICHSCARNP